VTAQASADHAGSSPRVAVVVLTFESAGVIEQCLQALRAAEPPSTDIVVVDNASSDDTIDLVRRLDPGVAVVRAGRNLGWAGGNALGIRWALERGARYVVLLNPDVVVSPGWVAAAVAALEANPGVGLMDFELANAREGAAVEDLLPQHRDAPHTVREVEGASGAALVVRASALPIIGLPDPAYFLYCEDVDWSWRARAAGVGVGRLDLKLWHASEGSSGDRDRQRLLRSWLSFRNSLRLYLKHRPEQAAGWIKSMFIYACSAEPPAEEIMNRSRPYGRVRNGLLVLGAIGWNALHLPATLRTRRRERRWSARGWPGLTSDAAG
jgi:GT2 family glycosyltransferase